MKLSIPNIKPTDDERAVSPVIGVILMVAITVILAAVIGAFVLNLGQSVGSTAPRASIGVVDAGNTFVVNDSDQSNQTAFYINHNTGDAIPFDRLKIVITKETGQKVATLSAENGWATTGFNLTDSISTSDSFVAGEQLTVEANPDASAVEDGMTYTFTFIDQKSGQTITSSTATLQ